MPMNPRLLRPTSTSGHPEANAWRTAVVSNGGSVSATTFQAVSTFCAAIDAAGIRDRFYRLNLFCGNSDASLVAPRVPLYLGPSLGGTQYGNALDTNNNFVEGDYTETGTATGGLKGNGSSKYLDTGFNPVSASASESDFHLWVHTKGAEAAGTTRLSLGGFAGSDELFLGWVSGGTQERGVIAGGSSGERALLASSGLEGSLAISAGSGQSQQAYVNGSAIGLPVTASSAFPDQSLFVAAANSSGSPTQHSLARYFRAYSIGLNLTATQASNYHTALVAFQTALGRQV